MRNILINLILIILLIVIASKISKKSLLVYVTDFLDYCKILLKNKEDDEHNLKKQFNELILKNVEKVTIQRTLSPKNICTDNDIDNIKNYIENSLQSDKFKIKNIYITDQIYYHYHEDFFEIKKFNFKADILTTNDIILKSNFNISLLFYLSDKDKLFVQPYIFSNKYGKFKINFIKNYYIDDLNNNNNNNNNNSNNNIKKKEIIHKSILKNVKKLTTEDDENIDNKMEFKYDLTNAESLNFNSINSLIPDQILITDTRNMSTRSKYA
jgi:hypothetical protein